MKQQPTNLRVLCKRGRKPSLGDIFAFQVNALPDRFFFGRVIATDTLIGNMPTPTVILIYLYRVTSQTKSEVPALGRQDLLVPPIGTNTVAWTRGFFETIRNAALTDRDRLKQHCFEDALTGRYLDEYGHRLSGPTEPVGFYGLSGVGSIDDKVSAALGVPLSDGN